MQSIQSQFEASTSVFTPSQITGAPLLPMELFAYASELTRPLSNASSPPGHMTFPVAAIDFCISSNFARGRPDEASSDQNRVQRALATVFMVFGPASCCATPPVPGQPTSCTWRLLLKLTVSYRCRTSGLFCAVPCARSPPFISCARTPASAKYILSASIPGLQVWLQSRRSWEGYIF